MQKTGIERFYHVRLYFIIWLLPYVLNSLCTGVIVIYVLKGYSKLMDHNLDSTGLSPKANAHYVE